MKSFQETQLAFARHLRAPAIHPAPANIEDRRIGIYRELVYNNIERFIANVFPVMRSLLDDESWHLLIHDFIHQHRCQTPYFLEISEEFLQFLAQERGLREGDPVFLLELAHYEWLELALDVSEACIPAASTTPADLLNSRPRISPLVVAMSYQYPVHKISPHFQPAHAEPTQLVIYRDRADKVRFMVANSLTLRLLYLLQSNTQNYVKDHLALIGAELQQPPELLAPRACALLKEFTRLDIISHFE